MKLTCMYVCTSTMFLQSSNMHKLYFFQNRTTSDVCLRVGAMDSRVVEITATNPVFPTCRRFDYLAGQAFFVIYKCLSLIYLHLRL